MVCLSRWAEIGLRPEKNAAIPHICFSAKEAGRILISWLLPGESDQINYKATCTNFRPDKLVSSVKKYCTLKGIGLRSLPPVHHDFWFVPGGSLNCSLPPTYETMHKCGFIKFDGDTLTITPLAPSTIDRKEGHWILVRRKVQQEA